MDALKYFIGGNLFVLTCIAEYAFFKFGKGKIKSVIDLFVISGASLLCLVFYFLFLFHITIYFYITFGIALFVCCSIFNEQQRKIEFWEVPLLFIIFFILGPLPIIFTIFFIYFDLDK